MFDRTIRHVYEGEVIVEVHHFYHVDEAGPAEVLARIEAKVDQLVAQNTQEEQAMTVQLDALKTEVQGIPNVVQSAVTLLNGIVGRLEAMDAAEDAAVQAQIDAIVTDIRSNIRPLADAVAANTPAESDSGTASSGPTSTGGAAPGSVNMGGGGAAEPPTPAPMPTPTGEPSPTPSEGGSETGGTGSPTGDTTTPTP